MVVVMRKTVQFSICCFGRRIQTRAHSVPLLLLALPLVRQVALALFLPALLAPKALHFERLSSGVFG